MDAHNLIPLDMIDPRALRRDRLHLAHDALEELKASIHANGLRMPIEVFPLPKDANRRFGLISGFRRIRAFTELYQTHGKRYSRIPAFIRERGEEASLLRDMIEENEIRAQLSPWEQGAIVAASVQQGLFGTLDEAVKALHPSVSRQKRLRIRKVAGAAEALGDAMKVPEALSLRQCLRLASAVEGGFADVMIAALDSTEDPSPETNWGLVEPYLRECEALPHDRKPISTRPPRYMRLEPALHLRREKTQQGWAIHLTGRGATEAIVTQALVAMEVLFDGG